MTASSDRRRLVRWRSAERSWSARAMLAVTNWSSAALRTRCDVMGWAASLWASASGPPRSRALGSWSRSRQAAAASLIRRRMRTSSKSVRTQSRSLGQAVSSASWLTSRVLSLAVISRPATNASITGSRAMSVSGSG
jgi:hypothetical protein